MSYLRRRQRMNNGRSMWSVKLRRGGTTVEIFVHASDTDEAVKAARGKIDYYPYLKTDPNGDWVVESVQQTGA